MLAPDHGLDVIPEDDLRVGVVLRLGDVDGLVGVDGAVAGLGQLLGNTGTQNGGAVQAENGIHGNIVAQTADQLIGTVLGLAETGLVEGQINIVIDMGMVGCKMSPGQTEGNFAVPDRQMR